MNWRLSALDRFQLISNSDAHSPAKLGREANLLNCEMSYAGLKNAIETGEGLEGTIEFFPEEGKYHFDGHRKCHICLSPAEAKRYGGICRYVKRSLLWAFLIGSISWQTGPKALYQREEKRLKAWFLFWRSLLRLPDGLQRQRRFRKNTVKWWRAGNGI